ncbi:hypothetical protein BJY01DRAFT_244965 [Aspergillus pseudoustus]|uniref:Transcription factor domain-containing protein n=1 Tax=Aspergillus pseudoustus TaxID=1810923 RepID=A0ABR4KH63_9EURO
MPPDQGIKIEREFRQFGGLRGRRSRERRREPFEPSGRENEPPDYDWLLEDYRLAFMPANTIDAGQNTIVPALRVEAILHVLLATIKLKLQGRHEVRSEISEKLRTLSWGYDQVISLEDTSEAQGNVLYSTLDYVLWYCGPLELATNCVVLRAEEPIASENQSYLPIVAAMSMIQHNRVKRSTSQETYSIFTDGLRWVFFHLNQKNKYSSRELDWFEDQHSIVGTISSIIENAATMNLCSPLSDEWQKTATI